MSRQRLSPSLGESSHHVCPRCSGTGTIRDNESLSLSILRLIEEEALKENTQEVHAIVPVPIASYLLNEKRAAVSAIETRQGGVRCVIVPNDQMETPHYSVLRVRKGEETTTLSYMLPKLHEEEMAMPSDEESAERKRPEQPALAAFVMPEVPPAPTAPEAPVAKAQPAVSSEPSVAAPAAPGLLSRLVSALKNLFAGSETAAPAEVQEEKKEEKQGRQQDRRKSRQGNRRDRNERREPRAEGNEGRENRDDNRRNRREKPQQNAEAREARQPVPVAAEETEKTKQRDEQQPSRRERNRRRNNDEKRQAQQDVKALNREEQPEQEAEQEERVQVMPRRKQRQLNQKVRFGDAPASTSEEAVAVEPGTTEAPVQRTELAKVDLPAVVENVAEQEETAENRDTAGMPRRSRRSPRHLRVSGQRRRRYRDERYPAQSAMPLEIACASPEMASGKVWVRYPVTRPQDEVQEAPVVEQQNSVTATDVAPAIAEVEQVVATAQQEQQSVVADVQAPAEEVVEVAPQAPPVIEPEPVVVETTHPEVIEAPVEAQPELIAEEDRPVAEEVAKTAEPAVVTPVVEDAAPVAEQPQAPVDVEEKQPEATLVAPVVEPVAPVAAAIERVAPVAASEVHHATAPMTKAPAPAYVPEAPRHSDWIRPQFNFDGKGSAGGHSATHTATAPATRPNAAE